MKIAELFKDILRPLYRQYLSIRHHGKLVECPLCGRHYNSWRPIYGRHADGSLYLLKDHLGACWYCIAYPRVRQLYYWLRNDYDIVNRNHLKILHIAPERQISDKIRKMANVEYLCLDKRCEGYRYPKYVVNGDVRNLTFDSSTFDLIICNHVLEHIIDDKKAMNEIKRVLKPNGIAILMVPIDYNLTQTIEENGDCHYTPEEREKRFGQFDHVRCYGTDYFDRLSEIGFTVERKSFNDQLSKYYGFMAGEEIIICQKS